MRKPPYLPFLDGPASTAPRLRPISPQNWLVPDTEADVWLSQKRHLLKERRAEVTAFTSGFQPAINEAAHHVLSALGETGLSADNLLVSVSESVSDDLCVMAESEEAFRLVAATLCAPTFWSLKEMMGQPLGGLHHHVPEGDPDLASRISRVFQGLMPGKILERFNWTVQLGEERFTPSSAPMKARLKDLSAAEAARELHLRVERQTLQKLPVSGALLFTIRVCVDPLVFVLDVTEWREAFFENWAGTDDRLAAYKGRPHYEPAICWLKARYSG